MLPGLDGTRRWRTLCSLRVFGWVELEVEELRSARNAGAGACLPSGLEPSEGGRTLNVGNITGRPPLLIGGPMKMVMTTTFVSLLAVAGVAYASQRRSARRQRFAFLRKHWL